MDWTRETAYVIGYTITDGCVSESDYLSRGYVMRYRAVEWQSKDRESLEIVKRALGVPQTIRALVRKHGNYWRLKLQGQEWVDAFKSKGVHPRKTFTCRVPDDLPVDLRWHFLRGVIDGDGSIMVRAGGEWNRAGYRRLSVSIASGNEQFLTDIAGWAEGKVRRHIRPGHAVNVIEWDCGGAWNLLQKVYADSDGLRLERKHDVWQSLRESGQTYRTAA